MCDLKELEHLKIPFADIKLATNKFASTNFIGQGGFGRVYKGQLPPSTSSGEPGIIVAVKRLDVKWGQGINEFMMEIFMLASYKHDNLVKLVGFCSEGEDKLLVYEHEAKGSLDKYVSSKDLTWEQRLRICLGAARGLEYLHDGAGKGHRVLHRDIKSANILLDANWEAKISDFGLSKIGPTNQQFTFLVTNVAGTLAYLDPLYSRTGQLTKESDVFSFGVVLFEVLCGRLAMSAEYEDERKFLYTLVRLRYGKGELDKIIMPDLHKQMNPDSLKIFSQMAYQCLNEDRKTRPTMKEVVENLQAALDLQILFCQGVHMLTKLWGSAKGGRPWSFQLKSSHKLRKISIDHETWIFSIAFATENVNGSLNSYKKYGGADGSSKGEISEINLDADEEIIGISGSAVRAYGMYLISSLRFVTNKNNYGPYGKEKDDEFSHSWDVGHLAGFYGRCGAYLDGLGIFLKAKI